MLAFCGLQSETKLDFKGEIISSFFVFSYWAWRLGVKFKLVLVLFILWLLIFRSKLGETGSLPLSLTDMKQWFFSRLWGKFGPRSALSPTIYVSVGIGLLAESQLSVLLVIICFDCVKNDVKGLGVTLYEEVKVWERREDLPLSTYFLLVCPFSKNLSTFFDKLLSFFVLFVMNC